jgi:hypothetical protein
MISNYRKYWSLQNAYNYLYYNIEPKQESGRHIQIGIVLASSDASYITETTIYVDRGLALSS